MKVSFRLGVILPLACSTQAALRCSFSNAGREQFPKYPPDGTFLPEIRLQVVEIRVVFPPRRQAAESDACPWLPREEQKLIGTNLRVGAVKSGGGGGYLVLIFKNMGQNSRRPFWRWRETRAGMWNQVVEKSLREQRTVSLAPEWAWS